MPVGNTRFTQNVLKRTSDLTETKATPKPKTPFPKRTVKNGVSIKGTTYLFLGGFIAPFFP